LPCICSCSALPRIRRISPNLYFTSTLTAYSMWLCYDQFNSLCCLRLRACVAQTLRALLLFLLNLLLLLALVGYPKCTCGRGSFSYLLLLEVWVTFDVAFHVRTKMAAVPSHFDWLRIFERLLLLCCISYRFCCFSLIEWCSSRYCFYFLNVFCH
jgi:hypothetical protein